MFNLNQKVRASVSLAALSTGLLASASFAQASDAQEQACIIENLEEECLEPAQNIEAEQATFGTGASNGTDDNAVTIRAGGDPLDRGLVVSAISPALSAVDIEKGTFAGSFMRFVGPNGRPITQVGSGGQIETVAWVTISGQVAENGPDRVFLHPTDRPYMLGVWSDVLGPTAVFRSNVFADVAGESWPASFLSGVGRERLRIDNAGDILFGDISGNDVRGELLQLRLGRFGDTGLLLRRNDPALAPASFVVENAGSFAALDAMGALVPLMGLQGDSQWIGNDARNLSILAPAISLFGTLRLADLAGLDAPAAIAGSIAYCANCSGGSIVLSNGSAWSVVGGPALPSTIAVSGTDAASASGALSLAIGNAAASSHAGAVAIGAGSTTVADNTVAVGNTGAERRITSVAAGIAASDAATVGQVEQLASSTGARLDGVDAAVAAQGAALTNLTDRTASLETTVDTQGAAIAALQSNSAAISGQLKVLAVGGVTTAAKADALDALAVGSAALAVQDRATAVGSRANAGGAGATAAGADSVAAGERATAIGISAFAIGDNALAAGASAEASGTSSLALGDSASSKGTGALAIGDNVVASSTGAAAIGSQSSATDVGATAIGTLATASGHKAMALGSQASATGSAASAIGTDSVASGHQAMAGGTFARALGDYSMAFGRAAFSAGSQAAAIGALASATGDDAVAVGSQADASQNGATAIGNAALAKATSATALGQGAQATHAGSTAIGAGAQTTQANQVVIGATGTAVVVAGIDASTDAQVGPVDAVTVDATGTLGRQRVAGAQQVQEVRLAIDYVAAVSDAQFNALAGDVLALGGRVDALERQMVLLDNRIASATAAAVAMGGAVFLPGKRFNLTANVATYDGANAGSLQIGALLNDNVAVNGALGVGLNRSGKTAGRVGVTLGF